MMSDGLQICQLGNPILRQKAQSLGNFQAQEVQSFIDRLITTTQQANGVGIAAPQVGKSDRIFIVASRPSLRYPNAPTMEPTAMINPRILDQSHERVKGWEGCLSIPGIRGFVPRYQAIEVEYCDRTGQRHQQQLTDFVARIFQHEYDHLEGIVFLDRVESSQDLITEQEYQQRIIQQL